jgi:hypothetical protein
MIVLRNVFIRLVIIYMSRKRENTDPCDFFAFIYKRLRTFCSENVIMNRIEKDNHITYMYLIEDKVNRSTNS